MLTANSSLDSIHAYLRQHLSEKRYSHSCRVAEKAKEISLLLGLSSEAAQKAYLAGLLHDRARESVSPDVHAAAGADLVLQELRITDEDVLQAIRSHTFGRVGMSQLEKIIFVADYIEDDRLHGSAKIVHDLIFTEKNLDKAVVAKAKGMLEYGRRQGWKDSETILALAKLDS
jgi:HD superfamily phosphohydrolase YqeK